MIVCSDHSQFLANSDIIVWQIISRVKIVQIAVDVPTRYEKRGETLQGGVPRVHRSIFSLFSVLSQTTRDLQPRLTLGFYNASWNNRSLGL